MEGKDVDTFACKFCTAFPNQAYGREKCPWITGWAGGHDGYREDSVKLHDSSKSHQTTKSPVFSTTLTLSKSLYLANIAAKGEKAQNQSAGPKIDRMLNM